MVSMGLGIFHWEEFCFILFGDFKTVMFSVKNFAYRSRLFPTYGVNTSFPVVFLLSISCVALTISLNGYTS